MTRLFRVGVGSLLLALGLVPAVLAEDTATETTPEIRAADLETHVTMLASEAFAGRQTTTEGERLASQYLAAALERSGCAGAGKDGSYYQPYAVPVPKLGTTNRLVLRAPERAESFTCPEDWNPFSGTANGSVVADLVFAGYGITAPGRSWDDYAGLDAQGKVVLVLRKDPGWNDVRHAAFVAKVTNAARHGAAALLVVNDQSSLGDDGSDLLHPWRAPMGGRQAKIPFVFVSRAVAEALVAPLGETLLGLEAELKAKGPAPRAVPGHQVRIATEITRERVENARNVVARIDGTDADLRRETVIVGAHYDHLGRGAFGSLAGAAGAGRIHPGADDNASGTAAVLEVARHFARAENRPRRSLLFVLFSGEEMGLLGSRHYVSHPIVPLADTLAMINMDMVGRMQNGRLSVGGVGTGKGLKAVVEAAGNDQGLSLRMSPGGGAPSDSLPFFQKKLPVLFLITGMHADYHRPSDTSDKIEYEGLARVARTVVGIVERVANADERLVFTQPPVRRRPPVLGISLGRAGDVAGVVVQSVSKGGAAAAAGLQAGDVIVSLADQEVRNAGDLRTVLVGLAAGKTVPIVVLRNAEQMELEIVPKARGRR